MSLSTNDTQRFKWNVSLERSGMYSLSQPLFYFLQDTCKYLKRVASMPGLDHFLRVSLPSSSVQMTGMISGLSLMCFSPLTLILTLYKAISISLPNTSTFFSSQSCKEI